jgi:hypothetical protein
VLRNIPWLLILLVLFLLFLLFLRLRSESGVEEQEFFHFVVQDSSFNFTYDVCGKENVKLLRKNYCVLAKQEIEPHLHQLIELELEYLPPLKEQNEEISFGCTLLLSPVLFRVLTTEIYVHWHVTSVENRILEIEKHCKLTVW